MLPRARLTVEREAVCHAALQRTLRVGEALLAADGDALDAKAARVCALGQEPRFNAGSGAVFAR